MANPLFDTAQLDHYVQTPVIGPYVCAHTLHALNEASRGKMEQTARKKLEAVASGRLQRSIKRATYSRGREKFAFF